MQFGIWKAEVIHRGQFNPNVKCGKGLEVGHSISTRFANPRFTLDFFVRERYSYKRFISMEKKDASNGLHVKSNETYVHVYVDVSDNAK